MPNCSINGCKTTSLNAKERKLKLYGFPKDPFMRAQWISACKRTYKFNDNNARICSKHFAENAFETPMIQRMLNYSPVNARKLKLDAIPTLYLPPFAETEVKIDTLCKEIDNIPIDEMEDINVEKLSTISSKLVESREQQSEDNEKGESNDDPLIKTIKKENDPSSSSDLPNEVPKKASEAARVTYHTLLSTYQKLFTENEELRLQNKNLKVDCDKHHKLYKKHLLQNIKLRQRNRALVNDNHKLRGKLKKLEANYKMEYEITDIVECHVYDDNGDPDQKIKTSPQN